MKRFCMTTALVASVVMSPLTLADWPTFSHPTLTELQAAGDIATAQCPAGEGQIKPGTILPVKYISKNQPDWGWHFQGNSSCFMLNRPLSFNDFTITHINDPIEHLTLYSIVQAQYAGQSGGYQFVLTTPPSHWFCVKLSSNMVSCANDI